MKIIMFVGTMENRKFVWLKYKMLNSTIVDCI